MVPLDELTVLQALVWRCMSAAPIAAPAPIPVVWVVWNRAGLGRQSQRLLKQAVRRGQRGQRSARPRCGRPWPPPPRR
ncbi:hypothetical protein [Mycobacterium sp. ZZG]